MTNHQLKATQLVLIPTVPELRGPPWVCRAAFLLEALGGSLFPCLVRLQGLLLPLTSAWSSHLLSLGPSCPPLSSTRTCEIIWAHPDNPGECLCPQILVTAARSRAQTTVSPLFLPRPVSESSGDLSSPPCSHPLSPGPLMLQPPYGLHVSALASPWGQRGL